MEGKGKEIKGLEIWREGNRIRKGSRDGKG